MRQRLWCCCCCWSRLGAYSVLHWRSEWRRNGVAYPGRRHSLQLGKFIHTAARCCHQRRGRRGAVGQLLLNFSLSENLLFVGNLWACFLRLRCTSRRYTKSSQYKSERAKTAVSDIFVNVPKDARLRNNPAKCLRFPTVDSSFPSGYLHDQIWRYHWNSTFLPFPKISQRVQHLLWNLGKGVHEFSTNNAVGNLQLLVEIFQRRASYYF